MMLVHLPCGRDTQVSDLDYDRVMQHRWHVTTANASRKPYVRTTMRDATGKDRTVYLHRFIADPPATMKVDHWDNDGLNNQRQNLRVSTFWENNANRTGFGLSGYKGVTKDRGRWRARITVDETTRHLGTFLDALAAARAYDAAAFEAHGQFAWLNFPDEWPHPADIEPGGEPPF